MDDNLRDFAEGLTSLVGKLNERLDEERDVVRAAAKARDTSKAAAEKAAKELHDKQLNAVNKLASSVGSLASSFSRGEGSFDSLTVATKMVATGLGNLASMIPIFGGAFKGLIDATGEAATFLIQMYEKMYSDYEKLSKVGMVTTTTDFVNSMEKSKLTLSMTSQVLSKFSKELAYTGSRLANTEYSFNELAEGSVATRRELQRLGVGAVEFNEIQIGYIDRLARSGQLEGRSRADLIRGTKEYALEIDKIAKLTGLSREEIQKERDARMRDARYRASIAGLDEKARKSIDGFLDQVKVLGPEMGQGLQDLIASGGVPTTEAGQAAMLALQQGGVNIQEFVEGMRSGAIDQSKAMDMMINAAKNAAPQFKELASIIGTDSAVTKQFVDLINLANSGLLSREELEKKVKGLQQEALKGTDQQNASLADTRQTLIKTQSKLESLALSSTTVGKAMNNLSGAIDKVIDKIISIFGGGAATSTASGPTAPTNMISGRALPRSATSSIPISVTESDLITKYGLKIKKGFTQKDQSQIDPRLIELAQKVQNSIEGFQRFTGFNDGYAREKGSAHPEGKAFDFTLNQKPSPEQGREIIAAVSKLYPGATVLDEYNQPSSKATAGHFHVNIPKMADGGVVNKPTVSLIGEAGSEAVVPLPGGRSIPVQFDNEFGKKLDALISLAERQNSMLSNVFDRLT